MNDPHSSSRNPQHDAALQKLGENIRILRVRHRIAADELGRRIGMHGQQIGRVERGEVNASIITLLRIAEGFEVTVAEMLEGVTLKTDK